MPSPKALLEEGVDPLHRGSTLVTLRLGGIQGDLLLTPGIGIDQRHNAQIMTERPDGLGILGRIHRRVKRSHLPHSHLEKRGSGLAIVDRGRSQDSRKGDLSIRHQKMELESLPGT